MRFGFHISIAGGFARVCGRAREVGCQTMQFFTRSPRGWKSTPLDKDDVERFRADLKVSGISPVFVHASYLVNLATADRTLADRSVDSVVTDMERCRCLGVNYLIVHVGRAVAASQAEALVRVAGNINRVLKQAPDTVVLLLENTAGMGSEVGYCFEHIRDIIEQIGKKDRVGVVLDTAHLFEAGHELRTKQGLDDTLRCFDATVGLGRLHLLHLNDSKTDFGSRVDRHWHIGKGKIGLEGFQGIVNHPLLRHLPGIMETPRKSLEDDLRNLKTIKGLVN